MLPAHVDARAPAEAVAERRERARQTEVRERLRTQLAGDPAHVLEARAHGLLRVGELDAALAEASLRAAELEQHGGERLAHLVVQLLRDAQPLGLVGGEHAARRARALLLEALEHLVEGERELSRLGFRVGARRTASRVAWDRSRGPARSARCTGATTRRTRNRFARSRRTA